MDWNLAIMAQGRLWPLTVAKISKFIPQVEGGLAFLILYAKKFPRIIHKQLKNKNWVQCLNLINFKLRLKIKGTIARVHIYFILFNIIFCNILNVNENYHQKGYWRIDWRNREQEKISAYTRDSYGSLLGYYNIFVC